MYKFPEIFTIDDVLPHIKCFDEIVVADKGDYTWIDYVVDTGETFARKNDGWEMRRECRGLIFNTEGKIISRPIHKIFNIGQIEETAPSNINWDDVMFIEEKRDGSMLRPFKPADEIFWGTRKGRTDTSMPVEEFAKQHQKYNDFALAMIEDNKTPLFEWTSPDNRIVIEYDVPELILLLVRDNFTGEYCPIRP